MKNFSFLKVSIFILVGILVLGGCRAKDPTPPPEEDLSDLLREGINNLTMVKSAEYSFSINGDIKAAPSSLDVYNFVNLSVEGTLDGAYSVLNLEDTLFSLAFGLVLQKDAEKEENVGGEMRLLDDTLYVVLSEISDFEGDIPLEEMEDFIGQWWYIQLPEGSLNEMLALYKDEEYMTPEEKQLKELFEETDMFKEVEYLGMETVGGVRARKYSASLDDQALIDYMIKAGEITGEPLDATDIEEISTFLNNIDFSGHIWIGEKDNIFRKYSGILAGKNIAEGLEDLTIEFVMDFELSRINEVVSVPAPEDSLEFDPLMLLGGGLF